MYEYPFGAGQQLNLNWIISEIISIHKSLDPDYVAPVFDNTFPFTNLNVLNLDWILKELKDIKELAPSEDAKLLKMVANALIAATYDPDGLYSVNDIVYRDDEKRIFVCINDTTGDWNAADWFETNVGMALTALLNAAFGTPSASDIENDSNVAGVTVADALNTLNSALPKNQPLSILRIGRILDAPYLTGQPNRLYGQSCCFYDNKYYLCGSYNSNANQTVSVWDSTGQYINHAEFTTLDHCNGLCAIDNYILIAGGTTNKIHVLNRTTLAYIRTISSIVGIDNVTGISNDNGTVYFFGYTTSGNGARTVYTLDISNDSYTQVAVFPKPDGGSPQNFCVYNGIAYFLYVQGSNIFKFNLATETVELIYDIPDGDGFNPCGECESLFVMGGQIYLHSEIYYRDNFTYKYHVGISQIFATDILAPLQNTLQSSYMKTETAFELQVNPNMAYTFNPYATYSTIEEACHVVNYLRFGQIVPQSAIQHGSAKVIGGQYSIRASGAATIDDFYALNCTIDCTQISISNAVYVQNCTVKFVANSFPNAAITFWRSLVYMTRIDFSTLASINNNRSQINIDYSTSAVSDAATFTGTQSISNTVKIQDYYKKNVLKPILATASGSNTSTMIQIVTATLAFMVLLTVNEFTSGKTITIGSDTVQFTNDFKILVNNTELGSTDFVTATALRRG